MHDLYIWHIHIFQRVLKLLVQKRAWHYKHWNKLVSCCSVPLVLVSLPSPMSRHRQLSLQRTWKLTNYCSTAYTHNSYIIKQQRNILWVSVINVKHSVCQMYTPTSNTQTSTDRMTFFPTTDISVLFTVVHSPCCLGDRKGTCKNYTISNKFWRKKTFCIAQFYRPDALPVIKS